MSIGKRVKELRTEKGMTRKQFAEAVNSTPDEIYNLELDRVKRIGLKKNLLQHICKECGTRLEWLETGTGPKIESLTKEQEIYQIVADILEESEDSFRRRFVEMLMRLDSSEWELLEQTVKMLTEKRGI